MASRVFAIVWHEGCSPTVQNWGCSPIVYVASRVFPDVPCVCIVRPSSSSICTNGEGWQHQAWRGEEGIASFQKHFQTSSYKSRLYFFEHDSCSEKRSFAEYLLHSRAHICSDRGLCIFHWYTTICIALVTLASDIIHRPRGNKVIKLLPFEMRST